MADLYRSKFDLDLRASRRDDLTIRKQAQRSTLSSAPVPDRVFSFGRSRGSLSKIAA
jgi:hypothetical protein